MPQVFSHFVYRDVCIGADVRVPIEPLVGHLRHPTVVSACALSDRPEFISADHDVVKPNDKHVQNKGRVLLCFDAPLVGCCIFSSWSFQQDMDERHTHRYMVIQPFPAADVSRIYPGRKILFDLGTGRFSSGSLPWFLNIFKVKGIDFDEIFGMLPLHKRWYILTGAHRRLAPFDNLQSSINAPRCNAGWEVTDIRQDEYWAEFPADIRQATA